MLTIGVCDDEPVMLESLLERIRRFFSGEGMEIRTVPFSGGQALLDYRGGLDVLFLDIRMEGPTGLEAARTLRQRGYKGFLIFVTILREYVFDAFEAQPFDYLVKPLEEGRFLGTLRRLCRSLQDRADRCLPIRREGGESFVPFADIAWCEVIDRKVYLHLRDGSSADYYEKMDGLEAKLDGRFFRCHRSYLVNLACVRRLEGGCCRLAGGESVPVARSRAGAFREALLRSLGDREGTP